MSKRRGTQHRRRPKPTRNTIATPEGYVVFTDLDGAEHLVYDPDLRAAMRHNCPICREEDQ
jgi:hypothetical protein